MLSDAL